MVGGLRGAFGEESILPPGIHCEFFGRGDVGESVGEGEIELKKHY